MDDLFVVNNGTVSINRPVAFLIPEVKAIVRRDRGGVIKGDPEGRTKELAMREIAYAWWIINVNSPGILKGLSGKELIEDAKKNLDLPKDWVADDLVHKWVLVYKEIHHKSKAVVAIKDIIDALDNISNVNTKLIKIIKDKVDSTDDPAALATIISAQDSIAKKVIDIPNYVKGLKTLYEEVRREERKTKVGKGDVVITSSMDPEDDD